MDKEQKKRYFYIGLTVFLVVVACLLVMFSIFQYSTLRAMVSKLWTILLPFVYGFIIAYMLLPIYNFLYRTLLPALSRNKKSEKSRRTAFLLTKALSVTLSMLFFVFVIYALGLMVLPETIRSIVNIIDSVPEAGRRLIAWAERVLQDNPQIEEAVIGLLEHYLGSISDWANNALPRMMELLNSFSSNIVTIVTSTIAGTITFAKNIVIGIIAAIYMLLNKSVHAAQGKKLLYSIFPLKAANKIMQNLRYMHQVFSGFITGKVIDSMIIGVLCYFGLLILKMPYAVLIGAIIGITNIIPFFGPFIGAIPSAIIILTVNPIQSLYFLIFILLLQQFDGNILGPKILGGSTGLPSFWVMFSIILFGGIMGIPGMIVGVPLFAVIISIVAALCRWSLGKKGLPQRADDFNGVDYFDEETLTPVTLPRTRVGWFSKKRQKPAPPSEEGADTSE